MKRRRRAVHGHQTLALAKEFLKSKLSAAGVSNVVTSRTKIRRHIWSLILLVTAGVMAYMTYRVVSEYLKYPKTVVQDDVIYPWLFFPGVTLCPLNPIPSSNLEKTSLAKMSRLKRFLERSKISSVKDEVRESCYQNPMCRWSWFTQQCGCVSSPCLSEFCVDETDHNCSCSMNMCEDVDEMMKGACKIIKISGEDQCWCDVNFKYPKAGSGGNSSKNVRDVLQSLEDHELKELMTVIEDAETPDLKGSDDDFMPSLQDLYLYGTEFDRLVLSCSFEGRRCDKENFTLFFHAKYGKCYMFNYVGEKVSDDDKRVIKIRNYGSSSGLYMTLQTEIKEAGALLRRDMGVRVVLHNAKELPFVSEHGFNIQIGDVAAVEVSLTLIKRLGEPWGSCIDDASILPFSYPRDRPYNQLGCQKGCRHFYTRKACGCTKRSFLVGKLVQGRLQPTGIPFCRPSNKTQARCMRSVLRDIERNVINCKCSASCMEKQYYTSLSSSFINKEFFRTVKGVKTLKLEGDGTSRADNVDETDMVGLKVYYKTLQVETLEEVPSYSWETLIANIGGNLGFFMGLSLVTFLEVCEFLWDIVFSVFNWNKNRIARTGTENRESTERNSNFFEEALELLRRAETTGRSDGRITELPQRSPTNHLVSRHPVDVYTLPRERGYSNKLYPKRFTTLGRRIMFKRHQVLSRKHNSFSSRTPYENKDSEWNRRVSQ